jgi:glyoxylate reductase
VKPRVFVVQPVPQVAIDILASVADVEVYPYTDRMVSVDELVCAAQRSDYIFAMHETIIPAAVVAGSPRLKGIAVGGSEVSDMIDIAACEKAGVRIIYNLPEDAVGIREGNAKATADLAVGLVLCLAYRIVDAHEYTRAGRFGQEMTMDLMGVGCTDKTVGLIGVGRVGRQAAVRLRALGLRVLYTKRTRLPAQEEAELQLEWVEGLDELLGSSDYVVMMADYNSSTHELMSAREFALMKPTAYFVNTGRGRLVNEADLIAALQAGTIAGAGLDVYYDEPPVTHDPVVPLALRRLDNVILQPHNGGATWDSRGRQTRAIAKSIVHAIAEDFPA